MKCPRSATAQDESASLYSWGTVVYAHCQTALQQIDATDRRIDELVYELYGLTDEEIKIVEG